MIARGYSADLYCDGGDQHHNTWTKLSVGGVESWRECQKQARQLGWTILANYGEGEKAFCPECSRAKKVLPHVFPIDVLLNARQDVAHIETGKHRVIKIKARKSNADD